MGKTLFSVKFTTLVTLLPSTVKGITEIKLEDAVNMGRSAVKGVMDRGKTKVGNKTMLDALYPAVEALVISLDENKTLSEGNFLGL